MTEGNKRGPRPPPTERHPAYKGDREIEPDGAAEVTNDRFTWNLGDGCRRVPVRGSNE